MNKYIIFFIIILLNFAEAKQNRMENFCKKNKIYLSDYFKKDSKDYRIAKQELKKVTREVSFFGTNLSLKRQNGMLRVTVDTISVFNINRVIELASTLTKIELDTLIYDSTNNYQNRFTNYFQQKRDGFNFSINSNRNHISLTISKNSNTIPPEIVLNTQIELYPRSKLTTYISIDHNGFVYAYYGDLSWFMQEYKNSLCKDFIIDSIPKWKVSSLIKNIDSLKMIPIKSVGVKYSNKRFIKSFTINTNNTALYIYSHNESKSVRFFSNYLESLYKATRESQKFKGYTLSIYRYKKPIKIAESVEQFATKEYNVIFINSSSTLYFCGRNFYFLKNGNFTDTFTPQKIDTNVKSLFKLYRERAFGYIKNDNTLWTVNTHYPTNNPIGLKPFIIDSIQLYKNHMPKLLSDSIQSHIFTDYIGKERQYFQKLDSSLLYISWNFWKKKSIDHDIVFTLNKDDYNINYVDNRVENITMKNGALFSLESNVKRNNRDTIYYGDDSYLFIHKNKLFATKKRFTELSFLHNLKIDTVNNNFIQITDSVDMFDADNETIYYRKNDKSLWVIGNFVSSPEVIKNIELQKEYKKEREMFTRDSLKQYREKERKYYKRKKIVSIFLASFNNFEISIMIILLFIALFILRIQKRKK